MSGDEPDFSVTYEDDPERYEVAASGRDRAWLRWFVVRRPSRRVLVLASVAVAVLAIVAGAGMLRLSDEADLPAGFAGVWEGTAAQESGRPVRLDLTHGTVGQVIGTSRYGDRSCSGRLTLSAVSGRTATVAEHIIRQDASLDPCPKDVTITLALSRDGALRFSGSAGGGLSGVLSRSSRDAAEGALGLVSVADVHAGDCFSTGLSETPLNRVSCAGPHFVEAVTKIDMSGQLYARATSARGTGCLYPGEIDLSGAPARLKAAAQIPTRAEWDAGAQFAICLVGTQDGTALTGRL